MTSDGSIRPCSRRSILSATDAGSDLRAVSAGSPEPPDHRGPPARASDWSHPSCWSLKTPCRVWSHRKRGPAHPRTTARSRANPSKSEPRKATTTGQENGSFFIATSRILSERSAIFQRFINFLVPSGAGRAVRGLGPPAEAAQASLRKRSGGRWLRHSLANCIEKGALPCLSPLGFRGHFSHSQARRVKRHNPASRSKKARFSLEPLEARALLASYTAASVSELIADITAANTNGGANTITLTAATTAPYVLTAVNNTTNDATGLPVIAANDNLTIGGGGDTIERSTVLGSGSST